MPIPQTVDPLIIYIDALVCMCACVFTPIEAVSKTLPSTGRQRPFVHKGALVGMQVCSFILLEDVIRTVSHT